VIPQVSDVPQHIAVIMDGNGRWAAKRHLPRMVGHERGVAALRGVVESCMRRGVKYLTVFAFSSENWRRPEEEVSFLMGLFIKALEREVRDLKANGVRLRVIGDRTAFNKNLRDMIARAETTTQDNDTFHLTVAANYGGRWDIAQAAQQLATQVAAGTLRAEDINEQLLASHIQMHDQPELDLMIRTGGDIRISNFLLWQAAYAELLFIDTLWPDFDDQVFADAIASFVSRERRFGCTGAQIRELAAATGQG
jgi:undecaprenyl diphosphate synthase